ncbi:Cytochrome c [Roseovarius sp. THAF9]|uniref:c-type cytochrome n=1 Tax=Roseovarius sp. THAF9 TaxID=2587847 RepID=UPI0012A88D7E|nr:c-type cytochrome [Roseovarius sp. THAF9]QFT92379.1 Cytochrome c [Roseovarius sp. THAF9]
MKHVLIPMGLFLAGCMPGPEPEVSREDGQAIFARNCAVCHGGDGTGTGPMAARLATRPADLTKIASRRGGVWPMLEVMSIIDGYTKRTEPREDMPVISELTEGPKVDFDSGNGLVRPTPARLIAVAEYLERIQSPPPSRYVP